MLNVMALMVCDCIKSTFVKDWPMEKQLQDIKFLYKYYSDANEYGYSSLEKNQFYYAKRWQFNDPFDFVIRWTTKEHAEILKNLRKHSLVEDHASYFDRISGSTLSDFFQYLIDEDIFTQKQVSTIFSPGDNPFAKIDEMQDRMGILCFCQNSKSKLMWSHYANNHKGFCIEYNVDKILSSETNFGFGGFVKYVSNPPEPILLEETAAARTNGIPNEFDKKLQNQLLVKSNIAKQIRFA